MIINALIILVVLIGHSFQSPGQEVPSKDYSENYQKVIERTN